jgi:hydrogenase expression/formation protein HypE
MSDSIKKRIESEVEATATALTEIITLSHGSGGKEMQDLISGFGFKNRGAWQHYDDDASIFPMPDDNNLVFTTDSFVVSPIFFPGGNIGHIACCGTINDLCMMGATPLGLSLGLIIEEGFLKEDLKRIIASINAVSLETGIPIVTGDTKVMEKGKIDKIIINTSGIGLVKSSEQLTKKPIVGDSIILSGSIGEHGTAILSKRFAYETNIVSDGKPLIKEIMAVLQDIKIAKDPTRGGIASALNELCQKYAVGMLINEELIPLKPEVRTVSDMLGINPYELACEGRFICICSIENAHSVIEKLKLFNETAAIIGEITADNKVILQTMLGKRILPTPTGRIVPRIC